MTLSVKSTSNKAHSLIAWKEKVLALFLFFYFFPFEVASTTKGSV